MALPTGGFTTYDAKGNREDLTDIIYNISPTDTPYISAIGRGKAQAVYHEWQQDSLSAAASNAHPEGNDVAGSSSTATSRIGTYCQIGSKDIVITGTQEAVKSAGRKSEKAYQMAKRGKELRRDMEYDATRNQAEAAGSSSVARKTRGLETWLITNDNRGAGGAASTGATDAPTDGTQRALTETMVKAVMKEAWENGGMPTLLMCGAHVKTVISGFTGRASSRQNVGVETIQANATVYASDFGDLKVVPNRFQRSRTLFLIDPDYAEISYLRPFHRHKLARTGDSMKEQIVVEWAHCVKEEKAHGIVADLLVS